MSKYEGETDINGGKLASFRPDLLRFASLQLGNDDEAEDAVQEALAGAIQNSASFRSEAALKTWVIAILRNKIADIIRQRQRRPINESQLIIAEDMPSPFDRRGMWLGDSLPSTWEDPEAAISNKQFLAVLDACLNRLPPQQARVFLLREVVELETEEICLELGLQPNNIHVILHRARLGLRGCLERRWFHVKEEPC